MSAPSQAKDDRGHYDNRVDVEEGEIVEVKDLSIITGAEIDSQITTAKRYPRSVTEFRRALTTYVTLDEHVARSCVYAIPRDGKTIEGPSARFAELLASTWGNNRAGGRIASVEEEWVTGQGFFFDLESNAAITFEVKRRITTSSGKRFSADMIMVTGNAAASIAHRNAVLKGVPKALWEFPLEQAKRVIRGDQQTLITRRSNMIKDLQLCGASIEQIYGILGVKGVDDITMDHMVAIGGIYTAIKDGETTVEEAFSPDKMKNPGEVAPPRPAKSEFERKPAQTEKPKEDSKTKTETVQAKDGGAPAQQQQQTATNAQPTLPMEEASDGSDPWERIKAEWVDTLNGKRPWVRDGKETKIERVKNVTDYRLFILPEFGDDKDESEWWGKLCDARMEELMKGKR